jgi:hypothetical protein
MLPDQYADGHFRGVGWMDGYIREDLGTAFAVLILTPSVFSPPPVACFSANPNPGYLDVPITFDPSCSYHSDGTKNLVLYEWDWDNDGTYDVSTLTPGVQTHTWSPPDPLGTYPVTLRVTDNTTPTPVIDTYVLNIDLTLPPHPPTADLDGPYIVSQCTNDTLTLDGSNSADIDEGQSESGNPPFDTITAWDWDLNGSPWGYDNETGETVTINSAAISSHFSLGPNAIGLRVTDNTALAYPGSQQPNLTHEAFGEVTLYRACNDCDDDLAARAKRSKIQLTWTHQSDADGYNVYRDGVKIAHNHQTTYATYLDSPLGYGTYQYRVTKLVNDEEVCISNEAEATTSATRLRR